MAFPARCSIPAAVPRLSRKALLLQAVLLLVPAFGQLAAAATVEVEVVDQHGSPVPNAVVSFSSAALAAGTRESAVHLMDQLDKRFVPEVIAIHKGDSVRFPNSDDIRHHVYSFSVPLTFELPLYTGEPENPITFREPGMVIVGCNIHDRMQGYIYILEGAEFAVSDAAGKARVVNLPAAALSLSLYHPQAAQQTALSTQVTAAEIAAGKLRYTIELAKPVVADTAGMTELEKKFHALRHSNH